MCVCLSVCQKTHVNTVEGHHEGYSRPVEQHEQEGTDDEGLQHLPVPAQRGQPRHEELACHGHEACHHGNHEPFSWRAEFYS